MSIKSKYFWKNLGLGIKNGLNSFFAKIKKGFNSDSIESKGTETE